jgi:hypothetical protein
MAGLNNTRRRVDHFEACLCAWLELPMSPAKLPFISHSTKLARRARLLGPNMQHFFIKPMRWVFDRAAHLSVSFGISALSLGAVGMSKVSHAWPTWLKRPSESLAELKFAWSVQPSFVVAELTKFWCLRARARGSLPPEVDPQGWSEKKLASQPTRWRAKSEDHFAVGDLETWARPGSTSTGW